MDYPNKYQLGTICRDSEGIYWVNWHGSHAGQGGVSFSYGSRGMRNIVDLLNLVSKNMKECEDLYDKIIKDEETKNGSKKRQ